MIIDITRTQESLKFFGLDGWLFADFHDRDSLGLRILGIEPKKMSTRRWLYFVPAEGIPSKLVHSIESSRLDMLPGTKTLYAGRDQMIENLSSILGSNGRSVAMQYSPEGKLPALSFADAGTVELVRALGVTVVSSADLVQQIESTLTDSQIQSHFDAATALHSTLDEVTKKISLSLDSGQLLSEYDVQNSILDGFSARGLTCDGLLPIVAVNEHAANPHFEVSKSDSSTLNVGDRLLIDLWARCERTQSVYYDITWCYQLRTEPVGRYKELFRIAVSARNKARRLVEERFQCSSSVQGWEVDAEARIEIAKCGLGEYFIHRTGHSIGIDVHGFGANMDSLETRDERRLLPRTCFSIEPGIYYREFGVRTEINVLIDGNGQVVVSGPVQEEIVVL